MLLSFQYLTAISCLTTSLP